MASDTNTKRVGWIGLGDLGGAMARRIRTHGVRLAVYDIDPGAVRRLTDLGATAAGSVQELAERSDIVMLSLPHPSVLKEVALGEGGLIHSLAAGSIVCDTSTNGRDAVVEVGAKLADKGIRMVEGPIGKGPWAAEKGELTIMMGGDRETLAEVEFLFRIIGNELYHCGPLGAGQVVKVANNLASCANLAVAAEAYALAAAGGADLDVVTQVMPKTAADSWQLRNNVVDRGHGRGDFSPVFKLKLARKDLQLAVAMAESLGLPNACAKGALAWYDKGHDAGHDDLDQNAIMLTTNPELRRG
jgi:3-hydroxyisobutyrate dehydrogenase-like beta-hydroxyacid dehydrogenase